jgi:hydroxymethylbilane synthase
VAPTEGRATVRVGARGSALSKAQTMAVIERLGKLNPETCFEFLAIRTSGDDPSSRPFGPNGVKGLFVKEIEAALLDGRIDHALMVAAIGLFLAKEA